MATKDLEAISCNVNPRAGGGGQSIHKAASILFIIHNANAVNPSMVSRLMVLMLPCTHSSLQPSD